MKQVTQLDSNGYFVGYTQADESPLEPGVLLLPAGAVAKRAPKIPNGKRAKLVNNSWVFEDIPVETPKVEPVEVVLTYIEKRAREYPSAAVLADAIYWQAKGDETKMEMYLAAVEAVKNKYPKPE